jgi:serine protease Do
MGEMVIFRQRVVVLSILAILFFLSTGAQAGMRHGLPDFTGLVKEVSPAVVNISTKQRSTLTKRFHNFDIPDIPEDSPFHDLLERFLGEYGRGPHGFQTESRGSGFILSEDGYIVTAHHVVSEADEILVRLSDGRQLVPEVIGSDRQYDIALLKVDAQDLPTVKIAPKGKPVEVGEWVLAIGSPFGLDHSATAGIVSALGRSLENDRYVSFIQTDVAINPGNSGGPLFNLDGEVIGVNSQIFSGTGGFMGLSFSIPIEVAMNGVQQLRTRGHVVRGWLGVLIQDVTRDLADSFEMELPRGALVSQVLPDSPAEQAGLEPGDVILSFNGKEVTTSGSLPPLVGASPVDKIAKVEVLRSGERKEIEVLIGELPEEADLAMKVAPPHTPTVSQSDRLGLEVTDASAAQREELGLGGSGGVLVSRVEAGPARHAGIREQDVIVMVNNIPVESADQFRELVEDLPAGKSVAVLVQRSTGPVFLAMRVPE